MCLLTESSHTQFYYWRKQMGKFLMFYLYHTVYRGKLMTCSVLLLDDTSTTFQVFK